MDAILATVGRYTNLNVTVEELSADGDPMRRKLAHTVVQAAAMLIHVERELGHVAGWVAAKTDLVRRALASETGQPLPTLRPSGELQARAFRFDALIGERAARIEHLQAVLNLWVAHTTPRPAAHHAPPAAGRPTADLPAAPSGSAAEAAATNSEQ